MRRSTRRGGVAWSVGVDGGDVDPALRDAIDPRPREEDADLLVPFALENLDAVRRHLHVGRLIEVGGLAIDERDLGMHPALPKGTTQRSSSGARWPRPLVGTLRAC